MKTVDKLSTIHDKLSTKIDQLMINQRPVERTCEHFAKIVSPAV